MMKDLTKTDRDSSRSVVRKYDEAAGARALRSTADAIDTLYALEFDEPTISLHSALRRADDDNNNIPPLAGISFSRAERLRLLAEKMEREDQDVNERLAKAGQIAAEAQRLNEELRAHKSDLTARLTAARKTIADMETAAHDQQAALDEATTQRDMAIEIAEQAQALAQHALQVAHEQKRHNAIAMRTIAHLIEEIESGLGHGDADGEIVLSFGAPEGLTPETAADLALAATLDLEAAGLGR